MKIRLNEYSHSKLDVARKCMLQFKYQYIDHLKGIKDTTATDFGEVCHFIAENYKGGGKDELLELYKKVVPSKYKLIEKYTNKIPLALKNIHDFWKNVINDPNILKIETEQEIKIKLNETLELTGKIDLLIHYKDDTYKIIDYKTNKSLKYADHKDQLSMYMLLLNRARKIQYDNMLNEIVYLALDGEDKFGNKIANLNYENIHKTYKLDELDVECLISEIKTLHNKILKNLDKKEWEPKLTKLCDWCKFKNICPAYKEVKAKQV